MFCNSLKTLMWKHCKVRLRRYFHTSVEYLSAIVLLLMVFILKDYFPKTPSFVWEDDSLTTKPDVFKLTDLQKPYKVLYYPSNNFTDELMDSVGEKLELTRGDINGWSKYMGTNKEGDIGNFTNMISKSGLGKAIVIFEGISGDEKPNKLKYSIRTSSNFMTHIIEKEESDFWDAKYDTFMLLQWTIDSSYIEILSGSTVGQKMYIQEFPKIRTTVTVSSFLSGLIRTICILSLMIPFVFLMIKLLDERSSGIQELIKMVGVSPTDISISHFLNELPVGIFFSIMGTVFLKASTKPIIEHTNFIYISVILLLHFVSIIAYAFLFSYAVKSSSFPVTLSCFAFIITYIPYEVIADRQIKDSLVLLTGLLPHVPVVWFWTDLFEMEHLGRGANLMSRTSMNGSILSSYVFLLIQTVICFILSWYLDKIRPGKYGTALPWHFLFQRYYWTTEKVTPETSLSEEQHLTDPQYFEDPPKTGIGIRVQNVSKEFTDWSGYKTFVLSNVSLNIYKGEITVLLGHNGAGKTTLMSIITGMIPASSGDVYVNDLHSVRHKSQLRKNLGLCPQHNLFFNDLTVLEHVLFFTMLKGESYKKALKLSHELLERLGLSKKAHNMSRELSGGMKRRLQLSCALAGDADVLILDEPTSGLDVETRRELWDLLLSLRGSRTILLTTHFMEEADALGDRVAALHLGKLKCYATPMYLKKAIGSGYRLSIVTDGLPREEAITKDIKTIIPDVTLKDQTVNTMTYNLPSKDSAFYPKLFNQLEMRKEQLGISSIGVGISTLDDVFLRLCTNVDISYSDDEKDGAVEPEPLFKRKTGIPLYMSQFIILLKRQLKHTISKLIQFMILQFAIPISLLMVIMIMTNENGKPVRHNPMIEMTPKIYRNLDSPRGLYTLNTSLQVPMSTLENAYPFYHFEPNEDILEYVIKTSKNLPLDYKRILTGFELDDSKAKVLYTNVVKHAAPVSLNILSNIIAMKHLPWADGRNIITFNSPISQHSAFDEGNKPVPTKTDLSVTIWAVCICLTLQFAMLNNVSLPCRERMSGVRHMHIMSGCSPLLYWTATLVYHMMYTLLLVFLVGIAAPILDTDNTMRNGDFVVILIVLYLGGMAFHSFMYLLSCITNFNVASIMLVVTVFLFGIISPLLEVGMSTFTSGVSVILTIIGYVIPSHTFVLATYYSLNAATANAYCALNMKLCPNLPQAHIFLFDVDACCNSTTSTVVHTFGDKYSVGPLLVYLLVQTVVYMFLVLLCQYGIFNSIWDKLWNKLFKVYKPSRNDTDNDVLKEEEHVQNTIKQNKNSIPDAMLAHNLHKRYYKLFRGNVDAVKGVNFSVRKGECFGLLGVNGAGKSTTFKMLTDEETPTQGEVFANGHFKEKDRYNYLWSLGYCPQTFGLDEFLTGRENLSLVLTLRGLNDKDVARECDSWIDIVGLSEYASRSCGQYSGGCARRLGAAAALCGAAPLALLDEPTAGVDVAAARRLHQAVRRAAAAGRALLLTSHSMEETQALCSRIAIMRAGVIRAIGSAAELRAKYAVGHAVRIQLVKANEISTESDLLELKNFMGSNFDCTLKDEHKTMIYFHINTTMPYSKIFSTMEELKNQLEIVEDYSVSETTLEEVFLNIAKEPEFAA